MGGERRPGADLPAASLEAFEECRLLAADISAGADADLDVEAEAGAADIRAEEALMPGRVEGRAEGGVGRRLLGAQIHIPLPRAAG